MRDRVNRLVNGNKIRYGEEFSNVSRTTRSDGKDNAGLTRQNNREDEMVKKSKDLFDIIDPYLEEQKTRMMSLMEHELDIVKMGQNETDKVLRDKVKALDEMNSKLREEIFDLKRDLSSAQNTANLLKVETDVVLQEKSSLMDQLTKAREQLQSNDDMTITQLVQKTREVIEMKSAIQVIQRDLEDSNTELVEKVIEINRLDAELKEWGGYARNDRVKKDEEISSLKKLYQDTLVIAEDNAKSYKQANSILSEERERYSTEINELLKDKSKVTKEISDLKYQLERKNKEYQVYRETYDKTLFESQKTKIKSLEEELEEKERELRNNEGPKEQLRLLEDMISKKDREILMLKNDTERLEYKVKNAEDDYRRSNGELEKMKKEYYTLEDEKRDIERKFSEAKESLSNKERQNFSNPPMSDRRNSNRSGSDNKSSGRRMFNEELELLQKQNDDMRREMNELKDKIDSQNKKIKHLEHQNTELESKNASNQTQIKKETEEVHQESQIDDSKTKEMLKRRDDKIKKISEENKILKEELEKANQGKNEDRKSSQPEDLTRYQKEISDLKTKVSQLEEENENLRQKLSSLQTSKSQQQGKAESTGQQGSKEPSSGSGWFG